MTTDRASVFSRIAECEPTDCGAVAAFLRDSPFVDRESVVELPEARRVLYDLDEHTVPRADLACADKAVGYGVAAVVSAHRYEAP